MAQSYVISGTKKGPSIDDTSEVILETDGAGNPTKVIGVDQPCELTRADKETLDGLGIEIAKSLVSSDDTGSAPQAGTDTAGAGPTITS